MTQDIIPPCPRKELGLAPSSTFALMSKWGPSVRTIIRLATAATVGHFKLEALEEDLEAEANAAAHHICSASSLVDLFVAGESVPGSEGSSICFVRPHRKFTKNGTDIVSSTKAIPFIPTRFLDEIFARHCSIFSSTKSIELFEVFSSHSLTRSTAGWDFEVLMHRYLSTDRAPLTIFGDGGKLEMQMRPSPKLIPGTAAGLNSTGVSDSFYWMPSVMNFPGVDAVLGDTDKNIFALQTTVAGEHGSPAGGLRRTWGDLDEDVRRGRTWHVVFVADQKAVADRLVREYSSQLKTFSLGKHPVVRVRVWGCVLPLRRSYGT